MSAPSQSAAWLHGIIRQAADDARSELCIIRSANEENGPDSEQQIADAVKALDGIVGTLVSLSKQAVER